MRTRLAAAAVAAVLAVAGCGDDGEPTTSDTTSTTAASGGEETTSTTEAGKEEASDDQRRAEAAVLTLADLPAGFTESPDEDEGEGGDEEDPFEQCVGEEGGEIDAGMTAEAESPDFEKGDALLAGSIAFVLENEELAHEMVELFSSERLKECFNQAFAEGVRQGAAEEGGPMPEFRTSIENLSFPRVGDETASYRAKLSFDFQGVAFDFPVEFVFARKGRVVGMYFFGSIGAGRFTVAQEATIIGQALGRVG